MPQPAAVLDATMTVKRNEALLSVELLNLDATSMKEIAGAAEGDRDRMAARILEIVRTRGKMHNPATNSGGVLVGTVKEVGREFSDRTLAVGERICPIVSLSLLPLRLDRIVSVDPVTTQVRVEGEAIIFASTVFGRLPGDFSLEAAVGLIDIAGAPARTLKLVEPGMRVAVLGAGKAGLVTALAARERLASRGQLVLFDVDPQACDAARDLGMADEAVVADLRDPLACYDLAMGRTRGALFDVTISVASAPGTEGAAILMTRSQGRVLFFGMATSFQTAALSAEGAGKDVELLIGNGFVEGCVDTTFRLVRSHAALANLLERRLKGSG